MCGMFMLVGAVAVIGGVVAFVSGAFSGKKEPEAE